MHKIFLLHLTLLAVLLPACLTGCATHGAGAAVQSSEPLHVDRSDGSSSFYVQTTGSKNYDADGLNMTLTAFLQSDAGMSIADNAKEADYAITVTILRVGVTDEQTARLALRNVVVPMFVGTLGGTAVGGSIGRSTGAAWGAGIGALLGFTFGAMEHSDDTEYVWTMVADVSVAHKGKTQTTRMVATISRENAQQDSAVPLLETQLAQEIARSFTEAR